MLRADGEVDVVATRSLVLGLEEDPLLEDRELELRPGDAVLVYTDGLTDAYAPRRIVTARDVIAALRGCAGHGPAEITQRLTAFLPEDSGTPRDDILVLVAQIPG